MKNRRTALIAFVLIAALCVGVGYAALSDTLTIGGTVAYEANAVDADVYFKAAPTEFTYSNAIAEDDASATLSTDGDTITVTVPVGNLLNAEDTVTFTATIVYVGEGTVEINAPEITNDLEDVFTVTTDWGTDAKQLTVAEGATEATVDVTVTIELSNIPEYVDEETAVSTATFSINFTATEVAN